jgi:hypothetical protein
MWKGGNSHYNGPWQSKDSVLRDIVIHVKPDIEERNPIVSLTLKLC